MVKGVTISPNVIQWAVSVSGQNYNQIAEKFSEIDQWTSKESRLSVSELNRLSKELRVPFGYFFLKQPPEEQIELLRFRTVDNIEHEKPSRNLIDTIKMMERRQSFMRDTLIEEGFLPLEFINSASIKDDPVSVATDVISKLSLANDWNKKASDTFNLLKLAASKAGILVMQNGVVGNNNQRVLDVSEFRAFVLIDDYAPLIFLNTRDSLNGKIFSLCHELVHIWLGTDELYNDSYQREQTVNDLALERFCNAVTAEMLLPETVVRGFFDNELTVYEKVKKITTIYSVSDLVTCIRLRELQLISQSEFDGLYRVLLDEMKENLASKESAGSSPGGNYYYTQGSRLDANFVRLIDRRAREGKLLYSEAYDLVGAKGNTYDNLVKYMEGHR